jgi:hypothetical protein
MLKQFAQNFSLLRSVRAGGTKLYVSSSGVGTVAGVDTGSAGR